MRRISPTDHVSMPWKNGGGVTREILKEPLRTGDDRFLFRLSIADVASDGPFSRFDGYDRHILLLSGVGMTLDCGVHGRRVLVPFEPVSFSGDWDVTGALHAGPVRDFNLIVDRATASSSLVVETVTEPREVEPCMVHILEGSLEGAGEGDTLVDATRIVPQSIARVAIARVILRVH